VTPELSPFSGKCKDTIVNTWSELGSNRNPFRNLKELLIPAPSQGMPDFGKFVTLYGAER
jgi:hypothetical protein